MQEPSVLDFIKSRMHDWRHKLLHPSERAQEAPSEVIEETPVESNYQIVRPEDSLTEQMIPDAVIDETKTEHASRWPVFLALGLGLLAQLSLEPRPGSERNWQFGFFLYILAALVLILTQPRHKWTLQPWDESIPTGTQEITFLRSFIAFVIALLLALLAFIAFTGGQFNLLNLTLWLAAIVVMILAFWRPRVNPATWVRNFISRPQWNISVNRSAFLALAVISLILFFRVYRLGDVPSQAISDHAEKLLDVGDVLNGKTSVFLERNTGREFFQFYLTAAIILLFKTGLTFLSLKIGTVICGLFALLYIFLLGREIGSTRIGLLAVLFAGIAYWPNVISRFGLRFPIYPMFYAPALYYLVWGLQKRNRMGFIISGLFLGLGLHGYSPFRVVPVVVLLAIGLYLLHRQSEGYRQQAIWGLFIIIILSFIVFIPLLSYMIENPNIVFYRALTRIGNLEQPIPGAPWQIFLQNLRNSLTMFAWDNGEIWPISIPHRPVLDVVTAVFFHIGVILLILRYIRQRHWFDIFTLLSIPMLMMPSILSLSFPGENPSLNRSAAAIIPVFLVVGLSFDSFLTALVSVSTTIWARRFVWGIGIFLFMWSAFQNYDLVFNQYRKQYDLSSWNTSEMGKVIDGFIDVTDSPDTAWLVGYPHWVDSRLVMINAGYPFQDNAIWPENFKDTLDDPRPKLFIINPNDNAAVDALQSLYPDGWLRDYKSKYENKDFLLFFVPAR